MRIVIFLLLQGIAELKTDLELGRRTRSFKEGHIFVKNSLNHYVKVVVQVEVLKTLSCI